MTSLTRPDLSPVVPLVVPLLDTEGEEADGMGVEAADLVLSRRSP